MTNNNRSRGFTILEASVVICIILTVFIIFKPTFSVARDSAMNAYCKSNLGSLGTAYSSYLDDNNGRFQKGYCLDHCNNLTIIHKKDIWVGALEMYFPDTSYIYCPLADFAGSEGGSFPNMAWEMPNSRAFKEFKESGLDKGSYCLNWWVNSNNGNNVNCNYKWKKVSTGNCENIPVLADGANFASIVRSDFSHIPYKKPIDSNLSESEFRQNCSGINNFLMTRHSGGVNVLFMDWSVRTSDLIGLYSLDWHKEYLPVSKENATWQWPDWMVD